MKRILHLTIRILHLTKGIPHLTLKDTPSDNYIDDLLGYSVKIWYPILSSSFRGIFMKGIKNNELVVHHNYLNESKFVDFTELELNLFITILYKMRQEKDNEVIFKSEDIKSLTNAKDRSYKEFERIICSLQDRTFYLKTLDGYERIKPFPTLIFNNEKKEITVEINKRMIPVFKELKEQFTQYSLKEFVSLENKYGKRLYQLLKQYEGIGKRKF